MQRPHPRCQPAMPWRGDPDALGEWVPASTGIPLYNSSNGEHSRDRFLRAGREGGKGPLPGKRRYRESGCLLKKERHPLMPALWDWVSGSDPTARSKRVKGGEMQRTYPCLITCTLIQAALHPPLLLSQRPIALLGSCELSVWRPHIQLVGAQEGDGFLGIPTWDHRLRPQRTITSRWPIRDGR